MKSFVVFLHKKISRPQRKSVALKDLHTLFALCAHISLIGINLRKKVGSICL